MSDRVHHILHWFTTEHGCATLDYISVWLLALEYFTIILGEQRVNQLLHVLDDSRNKLNPKNAPATAHWLTFGPVALVVAALVLGLLCFVVFSEIHNPQVRVLFQGGQANADNSDWGWKMFTVVLWKPLLLLGFLTGVWLSRSKQSTEAFEKLIRSTYAWLSKSNDTAPQVMVGWQPRQPTIEPTLLSMILDTLKAISVGMPWFSILAKVAAFATLILFQIGFVVAQYAMQGIYYLFCYPIFKLSVFILERKRIRRFFSLVGLAMLTVSYIIRMRTDK
jgi:hypothetical protein